MYITKLFTQTKCLENKAQIKKKITFKSRRQTRYLNGAPSSRRKTVSRKPTETPAENVSPPLQVAKLGLETEKGAKCRERACEGGGSSSSNSRCLYIGWRLLRRRNVHSEISLAPKVRF
ncbi:unnamed protein product [Ixodes persulcatus]